MTESLITLDSAFVPYDIVSDPRSEHKTRSGQEISGAGPALDGPRAFRLYRRLPSGTLAHSSLHLDRASRHVTPLRTHRRRPHGRPQCEPLEHQDQAPLPAGAVAGEPAVRQPGPDLQAGISNAALRTLDFRGGLDVFLLKARDEALSPRALKIKQQVKAKLASAPAA